MRQARSGYFPSFSVSTGIRGQATEILNKDYLVGQFERGLKGERDDCEFLNAVSAGLSRPLPGYPKACGVGVLTEAERQELIRGSEVFPFEVTKNPMQLSLTVSLPVLAKPG